MNKQLLLSVVSTIICLSLVSPTLAQTSTSNTQPKKVSKGLLKLPLTAAGACAGFVVGIPVCFVKKLSYDMDYIPPSIVSGVTGQDDHNNKVFVTTVAAVWLPAAMVTAFIDAPCYSFKHAVIADKPFSKEQFSLEEFSESEKE